MADQQEIDLEEDFNQGESGSAQTIPKQCSSLRKGQFVCIKGHACKIVEMSTSKTGKHGHAKVHLVAIEIFTGKKYEDICPSTHNMEVPNVSRKEFSLNDISDDDFVSLMDEQGETREDLKLPDDDIGSGIRDKFADGQEVLVTVLKALGQERIISFKISS
ncbi:eukaryotic translation initiation factor 5A-like [Mya arenaria]|uniref:eukaryotic translation initiation factor 5A-like n=1 Tax=Mya arenaria TaxID=6604 RepID=UPI0022E307BF|nr:eukaryotic translation initiation factor 5A-like [Mya arenaria]XP_052821126.1 eukaryotic translation initiation factor 5A-like [Mya arenaria]XP_052821458.1 eukaryotic translation initiation factor 5A-like [Mya arenaria]XP_052821459.1 eukaryotic translation initiation factor 5A-like [Mya arenaria]